MGACTSKNSSRDARELAQFQRDALKAHNEYRTKHGVSGLKMNPKLSKMAQSWAEHIAQTGTLEHSDRKEREIKNEHVGENVYHKMFSSSDASAVTNYKFNGTDCIKQWYDESEKYDFEHPGFTNGTGHFSQVVWKNSREIGIGCVAVRKDNRVDFYVVGNYLPAGNINSEEEFRENVLPIKN